VVWGKLIYLPAELYLCTNGVGTVRTWTETIRMNNDALAGGQEMEQNHTTARWVRSEGLDCVDYLCVLDCIVGSSKAEGSRCR
jgi:hypothetical protein